MRAVSTTLVLAAALAALAGCKGKEQTAEARPAADTPAAATPAAKPALGAKERAEALLDKLSSPCDKPHSLRTSLAEDPSCKRAPFAKGFVEMLIEKGGTDEEITRAYAKRYNAKALPTFELAGVDREGPADAKVKIVEFFDYGCPHCREFAAVIEKLPHRYDGDVAVYYMNFPLGHWPTSEPAARAALAAGKQGKFSALHKQLWSVQGNQSDVMIRGLVGTLGLDQAKFEADWANPATAAAVEAQRQQGIRAKIESTPSIFINGRLYFGPPDLDWLDSWIREELAVN